MATTEETTRRLVSPGQMASPSALDISMQIRSAAAQSTRPHGHSQSLSISSLSSPTRNTRRKSISSTASFNAVLQGMNTAPSPGGLTGSFALASPLKSPLHGYPSPPSSLPNEGVGLLNGNPSPAGFTFPRRESLVPPAASSGLSSGQFINSTPTSTSKRNRRASEGNHALMEGAPAKGELRCDKCGKGYKHGSCLTKHLWEHTPEWSITSKLLISKHQQVQLLEAASILVSMNPETPPTSSSNSDNMDSTAVTSSSSSTGDSPPPAHDREAPLTPTAIPLARSTRARSSSKRLSRSFQPPANFLVGSAPTHIPNTPSGITKPRPRGSSFISSGSAQAAAQAVVNSITVGTPTPSHHPGMTEDESLAAAVGLLSCSFGATPGRDGAKFGTTPGLGPMSPRTDVMMKIEEMAVDDMAVDDDDEEEWSRSGSRGKSEEDDGVFGKMEE